MNRVEIGRRIERLRGRIGLSTLQLAEHIGKSQATISRIENGKQGVSIELLSKIAKALRIHPFGLLTDAPLRHSVLLPPTATMRSDAPMRMLARTLESARLRARLDRPSAAGELGISVDELEAMELGYALPDPDALDAMSALYPVDGKLLQALATIERDYPMLSERLASMEHVLGAVLSFLRESSSGEGDSPTTRLRMEVESCLGVHDRLEAAEREASYFSIGHLSDKLLKALQDPEFHEWVEQMASDWVKRQELREEARQRAEHANAGVSPETR